MIPSKIEEIQEELNADAVRESANEWDDGAMDCWIADNIDELNAEFIDDYNDEWRSFCRDKWNEENEE